MHRPLSPSAEYGRGAPATGGKGTATTTNSALEHTLPIDQRFQPNCSGLLLTVQLALLPSSVPRFSVSHPDLPAHLMSAGVIRVSQVQPLTTFYPCRSRIEHNIPHTPSRRAVTPLGRRPVYNNGHVSDQGRGQAPSPTWMSPTFRVWLLVEAVTKFSKSLLPRPHQRFLMPCPAPSAPPQRPRARSRTPRIATRPPAAFSPTLRSLSDDAAVPGRSAP